MVKGNTDMYIYKHNKNGTNIKNDKLHQPYDT